MQQQKWRSIATAVAVLLLPLSAVVVSGAVAHAATCTSTYPTDGNPYPTCTFGSYSVDNNVWNDNLAGQQFYTGTPSDNGGGTQTLNAGSASSWNVQASYDATDQGSAGSIISYPETVDAISGGDNLAAAGGAPNISSSYSTTLPSDSGSGQTPGADDSYEAAYDIWLGATANNYGAWEVMIWTNDYHQHWGGNEAGTWTDPTTGDEFTIYDNTNNKGGGTMWFVPTTAVSTAVGGWTSGSVDITDALYEADVTLGWAKSADLLQIDYGVEISNTTGNTSNSNPETFTVNSFSVTSTAFTKPTLSNWDGEGTLLRVTGTDPVYLWDFNDGNTVWGIPDEAVLTFLENSGINNDGEGIDVITQAAFNNLQAAWNSGEVIAWGFETDATFVKVNGSTSVYMWNGTDLYHIPSSAVLSQLENEGVNEGKGPTTIPNSWDLSALGTVIS